DLPGLCRECGFEPDASHPGPMSLYNCLWSLADADLVSIDGVPDKDVKARLQEALRGDWTEARFRASDRWIKIQMALNMRHLGPPRPDTTFSMLVQPQFGQPVALPKQADIFVLMPFNKEYLPIYQDHICKVVKTLSLTVARADDLFTSNSIM